MTVTPTVPQPLASEAPARTNTGFFNRLTVPRKIGLLTLILGVPLAYSVASNVAAANRELQTVSQQQAGFEYLSSLSTLLGDIQLSRGAISRGLSAGLRGPNLVAPEVQKVTQDLEQLQQLSQTSPLGSGVTSEIQQANAAWQKLLTQLGAQTPPTGPQVFARLDGLLNNNISPLLQQVAQVSQLNGSVDPAISSLLNVTANTFPAQWSDTGFIRSLTIRGYAQANPGTGAIDPANQREYAVYLADARQAHAQIVRSMERAIEASPEQARELQPALDRMRESMEQVFVNFETVFLRGPRVGLPSNAALPALQPSFEAETAAYQASLQALDQALREEGSAVRQARILSLLLLLAGLAVAGILAFLVVRSITHSLRNLIQGAERIRQGDFAARIPTESADEFATLGSSLNKTAAQLENNEQRAMQERLERDQLQNNIGQFLDVTMDIAEGDLTKRGKVTDDILGNVVDSINLMTEELGNVLGDVQKASFSVTSGSRQMLNSTEGIRQNATVTTQAAMSVAQQTAEVNQQIQDMAKLAQSAAEVARRALLASSEGQQAVQETLSGMQSIRNTTQQTSERVASLAERSRQIGQILDTISGIASQTNLLSLHASIEAAGAGEAGERFSVVAGEVRQLADGSAEATRQVASLITGIQNEIAEVARSMRDNAEQVNQGYQVAGTAGARLDQIGELSRESARLAEQISISTREQVQSIEQMTFSAQDIAQTAERSQQSVEQGRAAAEQLQRLADQLNGSLARFRLPG